MKKTTVLILMLFLFGCGFHLRGAFNIPTEIQRLKISGDDPYEPFQRNLRQQLKDNYICILDNCDPEKVPVLIITTPCFVERAAAYGYDVQVNRATLQMNFCYEIDSAEGKILIPKTKIVVERDLTINPNAVLGTEDDRNQVKAELYNDGIAQLIRQLANSQLCIH